MGVAPVGRALPKRSWGRNQRSLSLGPGQAWVVYWLYALPNPRPEQPLKAVRLESCGQGRLAVAGITLYSGAAHPLRHRQLESLRVSLAEPLTPEDAAVSVDLGVVARTYAVPAFDPDRWLAGEVQGWGEEPPPPGPTTDLRVDVTASPDATLLVAGQEVPLEPVYATGKSASADGSVRVETPVARQDLAARVGDRRRRRDVQPPPASTSARRMAATCRPTVTATRSTTTGSRTTAAT